MLKVNNTYCSTLVDTASESTLIKNSIYQKMEVQPLKRCRDTLKGISGQVLSTLGETALRFELDSDYSLTHQVVVLPDKYLQTDVLLGMDIMGRLGEVLISEEKQQVVWGKFRFDYYEITPVADLKGIRPVK